MAGVAERRLDLILRLLATSHAAGPAPQEELARALDCSPAELDRLIDEITERSFYLPAGAAEDVRVYYDADGLQVETSGQFRRPMRLSGEEALALSLAVRMFAGGADSDTGDAAALVERLEAGLCEAAPRGVAEGFVFGDGAAPTGHAAALAAAAAGGRACTIAYLKSGAAEPDERVVHPYAVVAADAGWYLLAHCVRAGEVRVFRVDRTVGVEPGDEEFERPADFDPAAYLSQGMVYRAGATAREVEAVVRYAPEVAPWIRERGEVEEAGDGSVLLRMRISDRGWIVRHVLQFGGSAELLEPREWRAALAQLPRH
jgi:proteasome accessory factor C